MSEYKPGTVAIATVWGVEGVRVMRVGGCWASVNGVWANSLKNDAHVTDVRPLVVLDPGPDVALTVGVLRQACAKSGTGDELLDALADQIEAQTKPARIPEPGLWGVVEASVFFEGEEIRLTLVRYPGGGSSKDWHGDGTWFSWNDLGDPTLVREGVEPHE